MTADPEEVLASGLRSLGIAHPQAVSAKLIEYAKLILEENKRTNLTGARDLKGLIVNHLLDSLAPLGFIKLADPVVDLGSGAGFPGIPAAIANPGHQFVLIEPRAKRVEFLRSAIERLRLDNASVIKGSALGPAAQGLLGKAGTVLVRAVAEPVQAFALGLPLLRPGGQLLLYLGRAARPTVEQKSSAARHGGGDIRVRRTHVPALEATRHAWIVTRGSLRQKQKRDQG
jgi:16S rRNA (guanine527-N7)-methyltransferase